MAYLKRRQAETRSLPDDLGLDYSIEVYGFTIAWRLFWDRLYAFACYQSSLSEAEYYRVRSRFACGDVRGYLTALMDAGALTYEECLRYASRRRADGVVVRSEPKRSTITKWVPGDHYYALGEKFDSLDEAEAHLARNGYESLGLRETHAYREAD